MVFKVVSSAKNACELEHNTEVLEMVKELRRSQEEGAETPYNYLMIGNSLGRL